MNQIQLDILSQGFRAALILWHNHTNHKLNPFIQNKYAEIIHGILNVFPTEEMALIENSTFWDEWKETTAFHIYSLDHSPKKIGDPYPITLTDIFIDGINWNRDSTIIFHRWSMICQNKDKSYIYFIRYHFKDSEDFKKYGCFSFSYLEEGEGFKYLPLRSPLAIEKIREIKALQAHLLPHRQPQTNKPTGVYGPSSGPFYGPFNGPYSVTTLAQASDTQHPQDKALYNRFSMLEFD